MKLIKLYLIMGNQNQAQELILNKNYKLCFAKNDPNFGEVKVHKRFDD